MVIILMALVGLAVYFYMNEKNKKASATPEPKTTTTTSSNVAGGLGLLQGLGSLFGGIAAIKGASDK